MMYPQAFIPNFGIQPNTLSIAVSVTIYYPEQAPIMVPYFISEAISQSWEVASKKMKEDKRIADSAPKMGLSRNDRRLMKHHNPALYAEMEGNTP